MNENASRIGGPEAQLEKPLPVRRLRTLKKDSRLTKEFAQTDEFEVLVSDIAKVFNGHDAHTVCIGLSV